MRSKLNYQLGIIAILTIGLQLTANAAIFNKQVKIEEGIISGVYDDQHQVVQWLGVPYAQRATGKNRWHGPQKAKKFKQILDCSQVAPANIQFNGKQVIGEEGVLTLDIVRPDNESKNLPVMVFIHGGNNQTSNSRLWEGNLFAKEADIVYVSVQYRLGLLGFNNLPALQQGNSYEESGNFGLLDQVAALSWVKANIKQFGGDPKNITVSGFSAGGRDVLAMLISPAFKGKFAKAISFSGGLTIAPEANSQKIIAQKLAPLVVTDGMANNLINAERWLLSKKAKDKKAVRNYLTNLKAEKLVPIMAGAGIRMSAFPHLYNSGKLLAKEGFKTKNYNSVPLLLLSSSDEFSSFAARDPYFKKNLSKINNDEDITNQFSFANKYGSLLYALFNGQEVAENIYDNYTEDIYVCNFAFGHNAEVVGQDYSIRNGACHGIFLPFLTDQEYAYTENTDAFQQPGALELGKIFRSSLGTFMRTGNPNTSLLNNTWQKWNPQYKPEMVFDANRQQAKIYSVNSRISYEGILAEMDNDNSIAPKDKNYIIRHVLNGRWFSKKLDEKYSNPSLWLQ